MKAFGIALCIAFLSLSASAQQQDFDVFSKKFVSGYNALSLPQLDLSYVTNLQHIGSSAQIKKQYIFFSNIRSKLNGYDPKLLNASQKTDRELMSYETALNLQRLALEQQWIKHRPAKIAENGIINVPGGKQWYAWYLKRWVSDDVTPDQIFNFGLQEVKRVQGHIEAVRKQTGLSEDDFYNYLNDPSFFITDSNQVKQAFEHTKAIVYRNLPKLFADTQITTLKIEQGTMQALAQTPGYYDNNTFYYNLFNKPYNKRQVDWLFIHEAVPGHHYQACVISHTKISDVQQLFFYYGFAEGWAAYTEELGKQLGVYATPYDELGKWQWDIVRSVRVPLDIGLNYYGWTDKQALAFWKKNIRGQDDIAMREIARLRRWPAQAITYKYGALQILHWKEALQKTQGNSFDIRDFHSRVLNHGSLPIFMVKENVFRDNG
jgi:uncharacterized protein (DUF885 family)